MKRIGIVGLGATGVAVAEELADCEGVSVLGVDLRSDLVEGLPVPANRLAVGCLSVDAFREAGLDECSHVMICLESDLVATEEVILALKELRVEQITACARDEPSARLLRLVGADHVLNGNAYAARAMSARIANPALQSFTYTDKRNGVGELKITQDVEISRKAFESEFKLLWLGCRSGDDPEVAWFSDHAKCASAETLVLKAGDRAVVFGAPAVIGAFHAEFLS